VAEFDALLTTNGFQIHLLTPDLHYLVFKQTAGCQKPAVFAKIPLFLNKNETSGRVAFLRGAI
jgi:hypothetical protein